MLYILFITLIAKNINQYNKYSYQIILEMSGDSETEAPELNQDPAASLQENLKEPYHIENPFEPLLNIDHNLLSAVNLFPYIYLYSFWQIHTNF